MKLSILLAGMILGCTMTAVNACTGITLKARNNDQIYARTMEWGTFSLHSRICVYPRGHQYKAEMPEDVDGLDWKGKYGVVGIDALKRGFLLDGINEKGLAVGMFYHPGYPSYVELSKDNEDDAIAPTDVLNYVLAMCKNTKEARQKLEKVVLVNLTERAIGFPAPVHLIIADPAGSQLIVEWLDKKVQFYESKVGAFTNAPEYPWHLTNLRNYVNLKAEPQTTFAPRNFKLSPLGGGNQMLGLPGDFTPPSRFVRAAYFVSTARPFIDAQEGIYEAFRILDNFNVPLGAAEGSHTADIAGLRSATAWTVAYDLTGRKMYYHTQHDRQVQLIDVSRIDFNKLQMMIALPLDNGRQSVKDRTPNF